ncbi:MAG TPA: histidine kinase, partial [Bacteroidia bacterium]|nr:histidine kinase [Bacteroidia bacterium]
ISELQIKYDTDKKEAENKVLAQENKLQALAISSNRYITMGLIGFVVLLLSVGFLIIRQNKLRTQQLAAQFEQKLLRTQMNPHFIFNSLASIESFIYEHQPKEAGVYLSAFSRLMRLILENSASEYITLEKEVEVLEYYLSLQKLRLDDNLIYSIKINEEIRSEQIYLPPMLTQPFIENAIEHGFRGSKQQGEINILFSILNDNLEVQVIDNGIGIEKGKQQKEMHKEHKSLAMKITMERLQLLNKSKRKKLSFTITDLANEQTGNTGTKIVFLIPLY